MKKIIRLSQTITLILTFLCSALFAQDVEVKGKVTNLKGEIIKAKVYVKSTKKYFHVNADGTFSVKCAKKDKIKISAEDYSTKTIKIKNKSDFLDIKLKKSGIDYAQYTSFEDLMNGLYAGVVEISNDQFKVKFFDIRGPKMESPKLILDEFEVLPATMLNISPSMIKKVEVLNESGDIAKYGKPAIVVTTKK